MISVELLTALLEYFSLVMKLLIFLLLKLFNTSIIPHSRLRELCSKLSYYAILKLYKKMIMLYYSQNIFQVLIFFGYLQI